MFDSPNNLTKLRGSYHSIRIDTSIGAPGSTARVASDCFPSCQAVVGRITASWLLCARPRLHGPIASRCFPLLPALLGTVGSLAGSCVPAPSCTARCFPLLPVLFWLFGFVDVVYVALFILIPRLVLFLLICALLFLFILLCWCCFLCIFRFDCFCFACFVYVVLLILIPLFIRSLFILLCLF